MIIYKRITEGGKNMNLIRKIPLTFKYLFDKEVKFRKKLLIILGLIYFISPIDFIPEAVLLHFGIIDDITLFLFIISKLSEDLDKYIDEKQKRNKDENIRGKVIDFVEYSIRDKDEETL